METFHHIAIVVESLATKSDWYCKLYNAKKLGDIFIDRTQDVKVQFIKSKDIMIELLEPLSDQSPIKFFLKDNGGGGLYHIALEVDNLDKMEKIVRNNGGVVISRTKNGWGGMEVMFALYINDNEKQIIEYLSIKNDIT